MVSFQRHVHPISMNGDIDLFRAERCYLAPAVSLVNIPQQHFNHSLLKMYFFTCSVVISAGLNSVEKGGQIASSMQRGHSRSSIHSVPVSGALNDGRARRLAGLSITRFFMAAPASETADRLMKTK